MATIIMNDIAKEMTENSGSGSIMMKRRKSRSTTSIYYL